MNLKDKINNFLNTKSDKKKIVVVYGPTACGKTSMSIEVAKLIDSEVIGTDSRQIFKYLNIGTGKILEKEKEGITHHMIDIITPNKEYSVGEFKNTSEKIINEIYCKGKIPILCGGTGLYIDSLIYDFNIPKIPACDKIRNQLEEESEKYGNEYVYKKLVDIDPEYAKELHPNNIRYVIRAIEVKLLTGKSKTEFRGEKKLKYDVLFLTPYYGDREKLYNNINKRVQMMFDDGLVSEVKELLKKYSKDNFGMKTIGYREVINYITSPDPSPIGEGVKQIKGKKGGELNLGEKEKRGIKLNLAETIELVQKNNRNYAKKQLTWFRKYEEVE